MLSVMINRDPGGANTRYKLKVEEMGKSRRRRPTTAPLPGGSILQLDLGISLYSISMSGVCEDVSAETDSDGITIADRADLEGLEDWYEDTIRLYTKWSGVIGTSNYVEGKVVNIDVKRKPFQLFWVFRLEFAVETVVTNA